MKEKGRGKDGKFLKGFSHPPKRISLDIEFIKKRYLDDEMSTYDIAKELNTTQKTIYNRLKENNIKIRKNIHTEKTKQKIKQTLIRKGIQPTKRYSGKPTLGCFKKGRESWNKNKTGLQISTKKGKNFEEFYGEEKAKEIRLKIKEKRKFQVTPVKDTSIEIKLQNLLKQLGIKFLTHQYINIKHGYQCDIFIPKQKGIWRDTIIEAFGDYWHRRPYGREIDIKRANEIRDKGYGLFTFWESEIKPMQLNDLQMVLAK